MHQAADGCPSHPLYQSSKMVLHINLRVTASPCQSSVANIEVIDIKEWDSRRFR
ncbi:MAG: hypothetical protein LDL41_26130 [Coleofasciculus sp. S288]|nr:hypothetical protein [Coleofasciculus sp. S288]